MCILFISVIVVVVGGVAVVVARSSSIRRRLSIPPRLIANPTNSTVQNFVKPQQKLYF